MSNRVKYPEDWDFYNDRPASAPANVKPRAGEHTPTWVPNTHHAVPQPAGHECADWYTWANPSACDILYALAHVKGEVDQLRAREKELVEALELMLKAWEQLMPNLKHGVVQDYELVCTTAPLKARAALSKVKP